MQSLIIEKWNAKERELPGINCIFSSNGEVTILNCYSLYDPNTESRELFCEPLCDTTITSIEKYNASYWTVVDPRTSIEYQGGKIYGGDGAMGNEGFIACTDSEDNLLWGMFFESTNPIKNLKIEEDTLIATNEHSELQIQINLNCLTKIKMISIATR